MAFGLVPTGTLAVVPGEGSAVLGDASATVTDVRATRAIMAVTAKRLFGRTDPDRQPEI
jgi:hypothetical protein